MTVYKNVHTSALIIGRKKVRIGDTVVFESLTPKEKEEASLWVAKKYLVPVAKEVKVSQPVKQVEVTPTINTDTEVNNTMTPNEETTEQQNEKRKGRRGA